MTNSRFRRTSTLLAILVLSDAWVSLAGEVPSRATVEHDPRFDEIRQLIIERVADDIPSFGISVIHRDQVLWEENFGWADIEAQRPATPETPYSLASIAKSITATGVMLLADQNRLSLDDPVERHLGAEVLTPLSGSDRPTTVRSLLNMTAGIPMGFMSVYEPHPVPTRDEILRDHGGLQVFAPGDVFHYSNFSLGLAELVIESAAGKPFNDAMSEILFGPADMRASSFSESPSQAATAVTNYDDTKTPYPLSTSFPAGGAGAYASVADLRQYARVHLGAVTSSDDKQTPLMSAGLREAMHGETTIASDDMFALGWWVVDLGEGNRMIVSDGHGTGMALIQMIPEKDVAVICVMSTRKNEPDGNGFTNLIANRIFDEIVPGFSAELQHFWQEQTKRVTQQQPDILGHWRGYVRVFDGSRIGLDLLAQPDGDIHVTLEDQYTVLLTEMRYQNGVLEGWFPGQLPTTIPNDRIHDILGRIVFAEHSAQGYLNANFSDQRGEFELPSFLYLEREVADGERD